MAKGTKIKRKIIKKSQRNKQKRIKRKQTVEQFLQTTPTQQEIQYRTPREFPPIPQTISPLIDMSPIDNLGIYKTATGPQMNRFLNYEQEPQLPPIIISPKPYEVPKQKINQAIQQNNSDIKNIVRPPSKLRRWLVPGIAALATTAAAAAGGYVAYKKLTDQQKMINDLKKEKETYAKSFEIGKENQRITNAVYDQVSALERDYAEYMKLAKKRFSPLEAKQYLLQVFPKFIKFEKMMASIPKEDLPNDFNKRVVNILRWTRAMTTEYFTTKAESEQDGLFSGFIKNWKNRNQQKQQRVQQLVEENKQPFSAIPGGSFNIFQDPQIQANPQQMEQEIMPQKQQSDQRDIRTLFDNPQSRSLWSRLWNRGGGKV